MDEIGKREARGLGAWLPLGLLALASLAAFLALRLSGLDLATLDRYRDWAVAAVAARPLIAGLALVAVYALVTALSLPLATLLTLAAGFLFGPLVATAWVVLGATLGASSVFLAARGPLNAWLSARAAPWLRRLEAGFRRDALSYLLVLRLLPIFPFWLVNLVPAVLGVSLRTFVLGTSVGIVPGTLVYAGLGSGLGRLLEEEESASFALLLEPWALLPLIGLSLLALAPVVYKHWRGPRSR